MEATMQPSPHDSWGRSLSVGDAVNIPQASVPQPLIVTRIFDDVHFSITDGDGHEWGVPTEVIVEKVVRQ